jgi:crotonobetainyl-CoA hydratase
VVPRNGILDHARELAAGIARGAPLVSKALKEFMRATAHMSPEQAHQVTRQAWVGKSGLENYERMLSSDDFNEGARAFSEKRGPAFKGI